MVGNIAKMRRIRAPGSTVNVINKRKLKGTEIKQPESVDAAPLSSDDEDEDEAYYRRSDHSDSDNERQQAADIRPSFGNTSKAQLPTTTNTKHSIQGGAKRAPRQVDKSKDLVSEVSQPSGGSKRSASEMAQGLESHLTDVNGFTRGSKRSKKASVSTYGKKPLKSEHAAGVRKSSSQDNPPSKPKVHNFTTGSRPQKPKESGKGFRRHSVSPSIESSPEKTKFISVHLSDDSPFEPRRSYISPSRSGAASKSSTAARTKKSTQRDKRSRNASKDKRKSPYVSEEEEEEEEEEEALVPFILPDMEGLDDIDDDSKPVLSTQALGLRFDPEQDAVDLDSSLSSLDNDDDFGGTEQKNKAVCPMCHDPVDPELLQKHLTGGRMNVRKQTAFCRLHKRNEAQDVQRSKGYPEVDWATIESRFGKHEAALEEILEGRHTSRYAARLAEQVDAGEGRTLLKGGAAPLVPGYYGPRGARVMAEHITKRFSGTIRRRAVADRLIAARGHAAYVQAVLVPELAVRLIMDDLGLDEARARAVMVESGDLGELVQEETRDVVRWSDDEEHEQQLERQRSREDGDEDTLDEE